MKKIITVGFILAIALLVNINNVSAITVEPEFIGGNDTIQNSTEPAFIGGNNTIDNNPEPEFTGGNDTILNEDEPTFVGGHDTIDNPTTPIVDEEPEFTGGHDTIDTPVVPVVEEPTNNEGSSNNGGSSSGSRGRGGNGGRTNLPSTPSVLGAAVGPNGETLACAPHFTTFMRMGQVNNVEEVKKLQTYLNTFGGAKLPVTGFFGSMTDAAVKVWQTNNADAILKPWGANIGATGYFFKMSQWFANKQMCPTLNAPTPILN